MPGEILVFGWALLVIFGMATVGAVDDLVKLHSTERPKLAWQAAGAIGCRRDTRDLFLYRLVDARPMNRRSSCLEPMHLPVPG